MSSNKNISDEFYKVGYKKKYLQERKSKNVPHQDLFEDSLNGNLKDSVLLSYFRGSKEESTMAWEYFKDSEYGVLGLFAKVFCFLKTKCIEENLIEETVHKIVCESVKDILKPLNDKTKKIKNIRAYLFKIALNNIYKILKQEKLKFEKEISLTKPNIEDKYVDIIDIIQLKKFEYEKFTNDLSIIVDKIITNDLNNYQKELIQLFMNNKTLDSISKTLDKNKNTIKKQLTRVKKKIKIILIVDLLIENKIYLLKEYISEEISIYKDFYNKLKENSIINRNDLISEFEKYFKSINEESDNNE